MGVFLNCLRQKCTMRAGTSTKRDKEIDLTFCVTKIEQGSGHIQYPRPLFDFLAQKVIDFLSRLKRTDLSRFCASLKTHKTDCATRETKNCSFIK